MHCCRALTLALAWLYCSIWHVLYMAWHLLMAIPRASVTNCISNSRVLICLAYATSVAKQLPSDFGPTWDVTVVEARPFRSETTAALSSQASSCLRAGHGTVVDNTVESDLPLVMGSQIVVWKADTVEGLGGLAYP